MNAHGTVTGPIRAVRVSTAEVALRPRASSALRAEQSGFTLIEVLVAVALTAIGLLGLASLQITSLGGTQAGSERTQAAMLALDIADRMRHNIATARAGGYDLDAGATPQEVTCRTAASECTPAQLALADLSEWKALVDATVSGGDASIATSADGNLTDVSITIEWVDTRALEGMDQQGQLVFEFSI